MFKSQRQRAKFHALAKEGKISMDTVKKWEAETGNTKLPKVAPKRPQGIIRRPRRDAK